MTPTPAQIPFTAWEQAVFVVLFILMVGSLLYWFSRQQGIWQKFINSRDEQWQKFLSDQRGQDNKTITDLIEQVKALAEGLNALRSDFHAHDEMEKGVLKVLENDKQATQPRRKQ